tara:strand:+ start:6610 stop:7794 length:1185 start_codon:yes stop_codon:yes gene_type:complete
MFNKFKKKLAGIFKKKEEKEEKVVEIKEKVVEKPKKEKDIIKPKKPKETPKKELISKKSKEQPTQEQIIEEEKQEAEQETQEELDHIVEEIEEKTIEDSPKPKGIFKKITSKFQTVTLDKDKFEEFFEKLENLLLENNVALSVVDKIREDMIKKLVNIEIKKSEIEDEIKNSLKESINDILLEPFDLVDKIQGGEENPFVILFFGINGSGKTTTISKIAHKLKENKIQSVIAAADTFRAASIEQLKKHGEKLGIKIIHQNYGSDPAAVGFDAIQYARSHGIKVVLIDTAGRMHTKSDLLREMEKIIRVTQPNLKIFVAESITGNDATEQSKIFNENFGIDGTILTKADVDEKPGTVISIGQATGKPILFLGTGQEYKDLEKFDKKEILNYLGLD